ncbi:hypothetical protein [Actinoplanes sp. TFC3]|uniref:hypothetical protein n=1 Tax=Actinoplanes sp. TFC3 TaxID=1710355 RepID=UPI0008318913|nr:hypothetical protein [Actinoplanes sp. TFC3]
MTKNRRGKAEVRSFQAATGLPYMEARRQVTLPTLAEVMQQHPQLNDFGIGAFDPWRKTAQQRRDEIAVGRVRLASQEDTVMDVVSWLRDNITPIKTLTFSSYGAKHVLERAPGGWYVSNGEFIAAALIVGYPYRHDAPNTLFGMSRRDVRRLEQAAR